MSSVYSVCGHDNDDLVFIVGFYDDVPAFAATGALGYPAAWGLIPVELLAG